MNNRVSPGAPTRPPLSPEAWQALTNPRSIALVGASGRPSSVSFTVRFLQTNAQLGYTGEIFLINPSRDTIFDHKSWKGLDALPHPADVVAINLPDEKVLPAVKEAIAHGAKALMIHSGGFGERGAAGLAREIELKKICADAGVAALGPNCLGIMSLTNRVSVASMKPPGNPAPGFIAAIAQSGSAAAILAQVAGRHGMSFLASTGNEAVTTAEDLIAYAIDDPATKVIIAFIEALRRPPELFALAERANRAGKPIIVVKAGMTERGGEVSRGHTGALAGSGAVYRQAFAQAGVILCEDFDELAQTVELFSVMHPVPKRCNVGMLGTSGGELGRITDLCVELGVPLPPLSQPVLKAVQAALHLPEDVVPRNPVDAGTGFNFPGSYKERIGGAIRAVAADPDIDIIAIMQGFRRDNPEIKYSLNREIMSAAAAYAGTGGKPVVVMASQSGYADDEVMAEVRAAKLPALEGAREGLRALYHLDWYSKYLAGLNTAGKPVQAAAPAAIAAWDNGAVAQTRLFPWLAAQGIAVTPVVGVASAAEASAAATRLGVPAVMKIDTPRVVHKSDIGGVALGVTSATAAAKFEALKACVTPPIGAVAGESVILAPMVANGVEFYIGAKRDQSFGTVVVLGLGGRLLEILGRTALLVAPFDKAMVRRAIAESGAEKLLAGFRGGPRADLDRLAEMVMAVGSIAMALGDRLEVLDLNPVIVTNEQPGGIVADARLILRTGG